MPAHAPGAGATCCQDQAAALMSLNHQAPGITQLPCRKEEHAGPDYVHHHDGQAEGIDAA
jgi:hypothetical protein